MGNYCKGQAEIDCTKGFSPINIVFKRIHPIQLPPPYQKSLKKIGEIVRFEDPQKNIGLKWFAAQPYDIQMLGDVLNGKPIGQCLFLIKNKSIEQELPVIICTKISEDQKLSQNTLLLYEDKSYYLGQIMSAGLASPPKATGKGLLVTKQFIYQGQFKNGLPHGYGTFKTRSGELTGIFKHGQPYGECVERSRKGLFIGQLVASYRKNGKLINTKNEVEFVNEQYPMDPTTGYTMVEL